ncbi:MAG: heparinase II/III family protein, partial [Litorimonas sp.]
HSTLTLGDRSPGEILEEGFAADVLGPAVAVEPGTVRARRKEQSSGIWLECSHDGYKDEYGLVHRRRLFVGEDGTDIRGEDSLFVPVGDTPLGSHAVPYTLRFHFHPDVQVSLAQDLSSALLVLKGRAGWRFRTDGGPIAVEPSVYLGGSARPVRAQQLVLTGNALADGDGQGSTNRVRWSLRRLKGRSA